MLVAALVYHYVDIQCAEGLYKTWGGLCVTGNQCRMYGDTYYPYRPIGMCVYSYSRDTTTIQCGENACECTDDRHLSFFCDASHVSTCLTISDIGTRNMYQVDGKDTYADDHYCYYELDMYILVDGDTRLCVTRQQCVARDRFVLTDSNG